MTLPRPALNKHITYMLLVILYKDDEESALKHIILLLVATAFNVYAAPIEVNAGDWEIDYSHGLVPVDVSGIFTPIETSPPTLEVYNKTHGTFAFSDGVMRSVTSNGIANVKALDGNNNVVQTFDMRPTLIISIRGFSPLTGDKVEFLDLDGFNNKGEGIGQWQVDLNKDTQSTSVTLDTIIDQQYSSANNHPELLHQYKHMVVDWQTTRSINMQVDDLNRHVDRFLRDRPVKWDVAIVGHSRGGIFAHMLAQKLSRTSHIAHLHILLLDPTAATIPWGDRYPSAIYSTGKMSIDGTLYYDGKDFAHINVRGLSADVSLGTESDKNILGYNNYGRKDYLYASTSHESFPYDWLASTGPGAVRWLNDIVSKKDIVPGGYARDDGAGDSTEIVRIQIDNQIQFDGAINITEDYVEIWGELDVGPTVYGSYNYVGENGIQVVAYTTVTSAALSMNKDHLLVSSNTGVANYATSLQNRNLKVSVYNGLGLGGAEISIGADGVNVSTGVPGAGVSIGSSGFKVKIGGHKIRVW